MKKFFLAVSLSLAVVLTTAAHPVSNENPLVEKAFQKMFAGASNVNWGKVNDGLLKASFVWGGHQTIAIFESPLPRPTLSKAVTRVWGIVYLRPVSEISPA